MIKNAKVSLSAVKSFEKSVAAVRDYSAQFDKGISCFDTFLNFLSERDSSLRITIDTMQGVQNRLAFKIRGLKAEVARITAKRNELEEQKASLEDTLSRTPESFTMKNDACESHEIPNPDYAAIEMQILAVEAEIRAVIAELFPVQQRLERANYVDGQLASNIEVINGVVYSLGEKQNTCRLLRSELERIKNSNFCQGTSANESLKKIEEIVASYLRIKMRYENATVVNSDNISSHGGVVIDIDINKTVVQEQKVDADLGLRKASISAEDIAKHQIKFDGSGRICLYDNKTFGGKYTSYETRLSRTSLDDNPILGHYEGERGESKFIPSGRTVEGVIVKDILKKYGIDGIEYRNAEPDFEVCSEAVVKIKAMSENRENYIDSNGIPMLGNFFQADIACAKLWNSQGRGGRSDWNGRDVFEYRKANGLTWHEKCDTETMVLVRSEINLYFKHRGGCSECRMRDAGQNGGGFDE